MTALEAKNHTFEEEARNMSKKFSNMKRRREEMEELESVNSELISEQVATVEDERDYLRKSKEPMGR